MKKFFDTERIIKRLLEELPITRTNDNLLYICYWQRIYPTASFIDFFEKPNLYGAASYKCVERCRRKLQSKFPELRDSKTTEARFEESMKYENYAING